MSQARATFFVIGSVAEHEADLVRRIADEVQELANHTWSHPALARESDEERVRRELESMNDVLDEILGVRPSLFRAPFYDVDDRVEAVAATLGLAHTRGDLRPPDWHARSTAVLTIAFVLRQVGAGSVVGLHDGIPPGEPHVGGTRQATVDAVITIVPRLLEEGYECVTASELLGAEKLA